MGRQRGATELSPRARARLRPTQRTVPAGPAPEPVTSRRVEFVAGPDDLVALVGERPARDDAGGPDGHPASGRHRRPQEAGSAAWVRRPVAFSQARWRPGRSAVVGLVGIALLAVLVLGVRVAWARSAVEADIVAPGPPPVTGVESAAASVGLPAAGGDSAPAPSVDEPDASGRDTVVVHVVGQVRDPGVQQLPAGSRVAEALQAAGGATKRADLAAVNLARVLADGEQVRVPAPGEAPPPVPGAESGAGSPASPVPLNSADVPALETLPGVGPVLARRIVDWRTAHGRFSTVEELAEVSGIGEKLLAELRPLVTT